jgi:AcrR family transcriptional regulator
MSTTVVPTKQRCLAASDQQATRAGGRATGRVTKLQWLETALSVLISEGIDGVRVVNLAKRLNISKSGFYWHFSNRDDLLEEMKRYWVNEFSQQIILEVIDQDAPLQEKLLMVVQRVREKQSGEFDLAFTSWGRTDPSVRELVDRIGGMRVSFIKGLFAEGGFAGFDLEARARLFVVYFSWSEVMFVQGSEGIQGESLEKILEIIAGS